MTFKTVLLAVAAGNLIAVLIVEVMSRVISHLLHRAELSGKVYCYRSCLFVCGCVCLWVCYHDNWKLRASHRSSPNWFCRWR